MPALTHITAIFEVEGSTLQEIHNSTVQKLLRLVSDSQAVDNVDFNFGDLKPVDDTFWVAEVVATIFYDEDKVTDDSAAGASTDADQVSE